MTDARESRIVPGGGLDWSPASRDYLEHRPGYPDSFFRVLRELGVGLPGQDILDLGTGTGALAIPLARAGARLIGVDASEGQLEAAREAAARAGLPITFRFARAEATGFSDASFDVITASMCWGYFDATRMAEEVPRLLRPNGVLLIATLIWARDHSDIARATESIIQRYNEAAARAPNHSNGSDPVPAWSAERFRLRTYHSYVEPLLFTRTSWRGRIRASKWIGAALPSDRVQAFDRELDAALTPHGDAPFAIPHRITLHVFEPKRSST